MGKEAWEVKNHTITEPVEDAENFLAEASIDVAGDTVVMAYCRYRGLRHSGSGG